jgi:hypothetical protein
VRGGFLLAASAASGQSDPRRDRIQSHIQYLCCRMRLTAGSELAAHVRYNAYPALRAPDRGYPPLALLHHVRFLDWTGRQCGGTRRGRFLHPGADL